MSAWLGVGVRPAGIRPSVRCPPKPARGTNVRRSIDGRLADWQKFIAHLDERGENQVRLAVDEIREIVGDLADSAWVGPTQKHYLDYWRSSYVLPTLEEAGWTVDFTDYVQQNIGFCRLSQSDESETSGSLAAAIQDLVLQARRVGRITSITTTRTLEDGTSFTLSIDPGEQDRGDVPQRRSQTPQVSPRYPIQRLRSTEASSDSIRYDDESIVHWPVDRSEDSHQGFRRAVRRRVTDIEEGQGLGGYGCLATMSRKKSDQTKTPAIYSPAALGLRRVQEEDTLFGLVVQQKVAIVSINGHGHNRNDSIRVEVRNNTAQSVRFLVPAHTVFEQEAHDPEAQDLMLRDSVDEILSPNGTKSIGAYGLCMDKERASPSRQALLLTPWILSANVADQDELWDVTEGEDRKR